MERIVLAARLQFGMFTVGADNAQINRVGVSSLVSADCEGVGFSVERNGL